MRLVIILFILACSLSAKGQVFAVNGDAVQTGPDCYRLTPASLWSSGSIWSSETIDLTQPFSLDFTARFDNNAAGADGIVFAFQSAGDEALGPDGGSLGYEGISPSFAAEFDIYRNADLGDSNFDHIAVFRNGNVNHQSADNLYGPLQAGPTASIKNGETYNVQIIWEPGENRFFVYFNCEQRVFMTIDLVSEIFNGNPHVHWGFTAATGGAASELSVCMRNVWVDAPSATYTACPGEPVEFEALGPMNYSYQWSPAGPLDDPDSPTPVATANETTVFTAEVSDACGNTHSAEVTVDIADTLSIDLGGDRKICEGDSALFVLPEGYTYEWSDGQSGSSAYTEAPGPFWADAFYFGCKGSDTAVVTLTPGILSLQTEIEPSRCGSETGSIEITATEGGTAPYTYALDGNEGGPLFEKLPPGEYLITASGSAGCAYSEVLIVDELPGSSAGFSAEPLSGIAPLQVVLEDESTGGENAFFTADAETFPGNAQSIVFEEPGTFELMQIVWSDDFSCADSAAVTVTVTAEVRIEIPNIVTPNGDGANDLMEIQSEGIASLQIQVYSRWGNLLFEMPDTPVENGKHVVWNPAEYNPGVYLFVLRYRDINGTEKIEKGTVTLMR